MATQIHKSAQKVRIIRMESVNRLRQISISAVRGVLVVLTGLVQNASHNMRCLGKMALISAQNVMCYILIVLFAPQTFKNATNVSWDLQEVMRSLANAQWVLA